jgi:hypothetical protein
MQLQHEKRTNNKGNKPMRTAEVTAKYTAEELGNETSKEALINTIAEAPKGGIIHVHAYESKTGHGEVANYFYLKGVDYGRMKERSLAILDAIAEDEDFNITTVRNAWKNPDGTYTNRKAKNRTFERNVRTTYNSGDALFIEAIESIRESIINPRQFTTDYEKEGNGVYSREDGSLHIRDCQLIAKKVLRAGEYPEKATGELVALKNKLKSLTPVSKYRQVCLDGRFDYISVSGQIVMQDEGGNETFIGFAEHKGLLTPRIDGLEEELPSVKVPTETLEETPTEVAESVREIIADIFG